MYRTCIFCKKPLGANEVLAEFPVGRRLAFDSVKGRLWAVCPRCRRWNLTPIEERWEAIEECERLFSSTRTRVSRKSRPKGSFGYVRSMPKPTRLALEMALHEERERRALEGELWMLERAWKEAEEIAAISDSLLLPARTEEFFKRHGTEGDPS